MLGMRCSLPIKHVDGLNALEPRIPGAVAAVVDVGRPARVGGDGEGGAVAGDGGREVEERIPPDAPLFLVRVLVAPQGLRLEELLVAEETGVEADDLIP